MRDRLYIDRRGLGGVREGGGGGGGCERPEVKMRDLCAR